MVVPTQTEYAPNEAAAILDVSRPQIHRLIDASKLDCRMVGTHRRIPVGSLTACKTEQTAARLAAMEELTRFSNEIGYLE